VLKGLCSALKGHKGLGIIRILRRLFMFDFFDHVCYSLFVGAFHLISEYRDSPIML